MYNQKVITVLTAVRPYPESNESSYQPPILYILDLRTDL
jgi:hypothetical protein